VLQAFLLRRRSLSLRRRWGRMLLSRSTLTLFYYEIHYSLAASVPALAIGWTAPNLLSCRKNAPGRIAALSAWIGFATHNNNRALIEDRKQPTRRSARSSSRAIRPYPSLDRNPANAEARRDYNFAVARIFTVVPRREIGSVDSAGARCIKLRVFLHVSAIRARSGTCALRLDSGR